MSIPESKSNYELMKRHSFTLVTACLLMIVQWAWPPHAAAQCTMVCDSPDPNAAAEVAVNQNCEAVISASALLQGTTTCAGPFDLIVSDMLGTVVATGTDLVTISSDWLGATLQVQITDQTTGNSCMSYVMLVDNLPPTFDACPNDTVLCTAPTDPAYVAAVAASDNCDGTLTLQSITSQLGPDCNLPSGMIAVLVRDWTATDDYGNTASCQQLIFIEKATLADVQFPPDLTLDCTAGDVSPSATGQPTIGGYPVTTFSPCRMIVDYSDTEQMLCAPTNPARQIIRVWQVIDDCSGTIARDTQLILLRDEVPPVVNCADVTVGTDTINCTGTFVLPPPPATDNCGTALIYDAQVNAPGATGSGLGPWSGVSPGTYPVTYTVTDECGNVGTCTANVTLVDDDPPQAVCDEITSVSLGPDGTAVVFAATFDDGSYDNCAPVGFLASRDGVNFGPTVSFDCADLSQPTVMVTMRVYELTNPASWSDCMVQVQVEDKIFPILTCPADLTVDCQTDLSDLSVFGSPVVADNCSYTLTETDSIQTAACGQGVVLRTFTASDSSGNVVSCTQTITLENQNPFDGASIVWPEHYTVENVCTTFEAFHPDSLPAGFDWPTWPFAPCSMIAVSYEDQVFQIAYPACYKIFRKWTIIDWCQYDLNDPTSPGRWDYTQVIKVLDTEAPVVTFCPPPDTFGIDANCAWAQVQLSPVAADDCSPDLIITNDSPWADADGADASGTYPAGTHPVVFKIMDGCGNTSYCSTTITVADLKKPTPYCNTGVVAELQDMNGTIMATVTADMFNFDSYDNCTAGTDLQFFIRRADPNSTTPPTTTQLTFDCTDVGVQLVELWVIDDAGNADYCITQMIVQDNMDLCPSQPQMASVAGEINNEEGEMVDEVTVYMQSTSPAFPSFTASGGSYAFPDLPIGLGYEVIPEKNIDPLNGITTYDLVLIKRHILGMDTLDTPYKIIAADANGSGSVTTADVVVLTRLVTGMLPELPSLPAWRFVPQDYVFPDPLNPFAEAFPELIEIPNLSSDWLDANFVAIKVGDVNCSAVPNALVASEDRTFGEAALYARWQKAADGRSFRMPLYLDLPEGLTGLQFTIEFDPQQWTFAGVAPGALTLEPHQLNDHQAGEGRIALAWYDAAGRHLPKGEPLCYLEWQAKGPAAGSLPEIRITDALALRAAYDLEGREYVPVWRGLEVVDAPPAGDWLELTQNPVRDQLTFRYALMDDGPLHLHLTDLNGRRLWETDEVATQGVHERSIRLSANVTSGVYVLVLETERGRQARKVLVAN